VVVNVSLNGNAVDSFQPVISIFASCKAIVFVIVTGPALLLCVTESGTESVRKY
jgi:hypothetical protein